MSVRHDLFVLFLVVGLSLGCMALSSPPVSAVCTAEPPAAYAGATIAVHVTPVGFPPLRRLTYTYSSTDGEVTADGSSTGIINTTGLRPGNHNVSSLVSDDREPKHRLVASCQASITIKEPVKHPPAMHVRVEPEAVNSGDPVTVTAEGFSRDNRSLTFHCISNRGALAGSGSHFVLNTFGLDSGTVKIDCTVQDDRALSGFASTEVTITSPPPPPPAARRYGEPICFRVDKRHATRLDNVGKAILDRFADALVAGPSATAVIVGYDDAAEHAPKRYPKARLVDRAAQCAVNTKAYLVDEKGIDPRRIELRTAAEETQQVILWLVPAGASMDTSSTVLVDESQVKPVRRNSVH
jgi:hypothetical protein